jgi:hypothetical protein
MENPSMMDTPRAFTSIAASDSLRAKEFKEIDLKIRVADGSSVAERDVCPESIRAPPELQNGGCPLSVGEGLFVSPSEVGSTASR